MRWTLPLLAVLLAGTVRGQDRSPEKQSAAVRLALGWLVRHQAEDGSWRVADYVDRCGRDRNIEGRCTPNPGDPTYDIGVSALSLLALLWNDGPESPAVKKGLEWIAKQQGRDGSIEGAGDKKNMYNHVLATLALVEACRARGPAAERAPVAPSDEDRRRITAWIDQLGAEAPADREKATEALGREFDKAEKILEEESRRRTDPEVVARIRQILDKNFVCCPDPATARALSYLLAQQNPGKGWRTFGARDSNESSITGWAALALLSALKAKLIRHALPIKGALDWFDDAMSEDGRIGYTQKPEEPGEQEYPGHLALIPLANLARLAYGRSPSDPGIVRGTRWIEKYSPEWDPNSLKADFTYWFLGVLYLAQRDGGKGDRWASWSAAVQKELTGHQVNLKEICRTGSWEPVDFWSESAGRVYVTAMGALALTVCEGRAPKFSVK